MCTCVCRAGRVVARLWSWKVSEMNLPSCLALLSFFLFAVSFIQHSSIAISFTLETYSASSTHCRSCYPAPTEPTSFTWSWNPSVTQATEITTEAAATRGATCAKTTSSSASVRRATTKTAISVRTAPSAPPQTRMVDHRCSLARGTMRWLRISTILCALPATLGR